MHGPNISFFYAYCVFRTSAHNTALDQTCVTDALSPIITAQKSNSQRVDSSVVLGEVADLGLTTSEEDYYP